MAKSPVKVHVRTGNFHYETADCLLVFWDKRCLDKITDNSRLLHLAGKDATAFWMEHRKKGGFGRNNVLITAGGKLMCQKIFHVACDINSIIKAAKDGLTRAEQSKMKTVIIPLLDKDTLKIDIDKCHKEIKMAVKELTTVLNIVQSVTLVIGGNLPLNSKVVQKESKMHGTEEKPEANKRNHCSVHNVKSDNPSRSAPKMTMAQNVSLDEPLHDPKTHLQPITETNKKNHRSVHNVKSDNPSGSAIKTKMAQNVSLDEPVHDPKTHLQPKTEANKRDQHSVSKEKLVKTSRSAPAETMAQNVSPDGPVCDVYNLQQPMTEANKRDHHSVNKEKSVKPRFAPAETMAQNVSPDGPVCDVYNLQQPMTEANKRDQHSVNKEKSVKTSRSAPAETMAQNISPDGPVCDVHTLQQPMTEANKRDQHSVSKEKLVKTSRSAPAETMAQNVSPDRPVCDVYNLQQPMTEANKRDQLSVNKEKSVKTSRSAPAETMAQNISPDGPVCDVHTLQQPMTEANKRDQPSVSKEKSVKTSRSAPSETMAQNVSPDGPVCDVHTFQQPMTDARGLKHVTKPIKVEQFQTPKDLDLHDPDGLVEQPENTDQKETPFSSLKEISGVVFTTKDNSDVTTHQMNITKHYLESSTLDEEPCDYRTSLNNVSEVEFKALQIIENGFKKEEGVYISWDANSLVICGSPTSSLFVKKRLTRILEAIRKKQSSEVSLDEEEKKIVQAVIGEVQSKDTICIYDEKMNQVVVYSDKQDDIRKFKHKLKIQTGKVKESGRKKQRFAENSPLLEECQENFSSLQKSKDIRQELSLSKTASDEVFYTKENIKVAVYVANILHLPVDCIVNAANDSLSHGGGVAKVIADAAGSELILQGNATIMKYRNGKIPVGFQVTTSAGRLPYRCVIHTVGPCWADYEPHNLQKVKDCEKDLYRAIFGCFLEAEKYGLSSIALPAISSGIYAVPQEMCAVQYAKAVLDYSRNSRQGLALKEIHFIDKLPHVVKLIQDTFRTMIQNGNVPNYNIQNYVASSSHYQLKQSKDIGWKEHGKEDIPADNSQYETAKLKELSPFHYESNVHHTKQFVFQVSTKPVVCIYKGDILKVKNMDAVVCPDDARGSGIGRIAIDLGTKAKYRQQKENCFERQKPDLGDVVITNGEENCFNMIVHVVIENHSPQKPELTSTMKKSIDNILRKTNERENVKTIALPLFGVKPELLTEKSWAELFLERFVAFCCEVRNPNLEEVHIITHFASKTAYSTVKKVFIEFANKVNKTKLQMKEPPPKLLPPKDSRTNDHKKDTQSGRGHDSKNGDNDIDDSCPICMCPKTDPKALSCGHSFCSECIDQMFKHKPVCPICGKIVGTLTGDQPEDGSMDVRTSSLRLAGYEKYDSIVITYDFPAGKQGRNHPSPGVQYGHMTRTAYLPNTPEGKKVCAMLKLAFKRRLVFTISTSRTTGKEGLTWNDIHHKTNPNPGAQFGYPDPEYLTRVKDELSAKGITEADLHTE